MSEIVKRLSVERAKHATLEDLLRGKGFYAGDSGWNEYLKRLNKLAVTKLREVDVVIFRPEEAEFCEFTKVEQPVYAARQLKPASLFEILAVIPSRGDRQARQQFCAELGNDFLLQVHGHFAESWLRRDFPCIKGKYGWSLDFGTSVSTSRNRTWYAGFRKV